MPRDKQKTVSEQEITSELILPDSPPQEDGPLPLVALVGRPNVGKSSLFNRLAGVRKAIVDPTPGVTRDRHYQRVLWAGVPFTLIDTGGVDFYDSQEGQGDSFNRLIREQSQQAVEDADIILFMLDARDGLMPDDLELAGILRRCGKPVFYLVNKLDAPEQLDKLLGVFYELGVERLWPVSAAHGLGISELLDELVAGLPKPAGEQAGSEAGKRPVRLAFIGRPNAGKSSLINRLLGEERMLVSDIPGTTRDSVDSILQRGEREYLLIDTAGIRRKGKVRQRVEKFSVIRALRALEQCDIAILVIDAGEGIGEQDSKIIGYALERGRACLVLVNKWDLLKSDKTAQQRLVSEVERVTHFVGYAPLHKVSALTGTGTGRILPIIDKLYRQYSSEFPTSLLNRTLAEAIEAHPPALYKGKRLKFYYVTQISSRPPSLVIFCNQPKGVHFSYSRFLVNRFRDALGLDQVGLRVFFRERSRREREGQKKSNKRKKN